MTHHPKSNMEKQYKTPAEQRQRIIDRLNSSPEKHLAQLLAVARNRAKAVGMEFSVEVTDLPIPTHCALLGIELGWCKYGKGVGANRDTAPSLDRLDSRKGYVPGNVRIISMKANRMKSDATAAELKLLASNIDRYLNGGRQK